MGKITHSRIPVLILFIFIYAVLTIYVMQRFSNVSYMGNAPDYRATLDKMVNGTAFRPFVYRTLVPSLIRVVIDVTPNVVQQAANVSLQNSIFAKMLGEYTISYMQALLAIIIYFCLCGYIITLYKMGELFFPESWAMALFMPIIGLVMIPAFTLHGIYIYDFSVLFLTAACYYCMAKQKWPLYFLWFMLACINKETSIFILIFFVLWYLPRLDIKQFILYGAIQCIIYTLVRIILIATFKNNPGDYLERHGYLEILSILGTYDFMRLGMYFMLFFLLTYRWQEKPLFARYILWIYPMMLMAYTLYGYPGEYRVFFDLFPLLTVLITHTLIEGTGIAKAALFNRIEYSHAHSSVD